MSKYSSVKSIAKSTLDRINDLEQQAKSTQETTQKVLQTLLDQKKQIEVLDEFLSATVELYGTEEVSNHIQARRQGVADAKAREEEKSLLSAIADGYVVAEGVVGEKSLIVGFEKDADGKPVGPGRFQVVYPAISPDYQTQLLGQPIGTTIKTSTGGTFEVQEIYGIDVEKFQAVMKNKAAAQSAEAGNAAAADEVADSAVGE